MMADHSYLRNVDGRMEIGKLPPKLKTLFFKEVEYCKGVTARKRIEKEVQEGFNTNVSQIFSWDRSRMGSSFWSEVYYGVWDSEYNEEEVIKEVNEEDLFNSVLSKIKSI